jgi:hypothetical protein
VGDEAGVGGAGSAGAGKAGTEIDDAGMMTSFMMRLISLAGDGVVEGYPLSQACFAGHVLTRFSGETT